MTARQDHANVISPVTIFVPMPTGSPARGGGLPVREVERATPPGRRDQFRQRFAAELERQGLAANPEGQTAQAYGPGGRRTRLLRREEIENSGVAPVPASRSGQTGIAPNGALEGAPERAKPVPVRLTALLDGPDRATAIDAVYRMVEGFGTGQAGRGAYFDIRI